MLEFHYLYYLHFLIGRWFIQRPYENYRFIVDFPNSNIGWHLSWFIVTYAYDVAFPKLGVMPIEFVPSDELFV